METKSGQSVPYDFAGAKYSDASEKLLSGKEDDGVDLGTGQGPQENRSVDRLFGRLLLICSLSGSVVWQTKNGGCNWRKTALTHAPYFVFVLGTVVVFLDFMLVFSYIVIATFGFLYTSKPRFWHLLEDTVTWDEVVIAKREQDAGHVWHEPSKLYTRNHTVGVAVSATVGKETFRSHYQTALKGMVRWQIKLVLTVFVVDLGAAVIEYSLYDTLYQKVSNSQFVGSFLTAVVSAFIRTAFLGLHFLTAGCMAAQYAAIERGLECEFVSPVFASALHSVVADRCRATSRWFQVPVAAFESILVGIIVIGVFVAHQYSSGGTVTESERPLAALYFCNAFFRVLMWLTLFAVPPAIITQRHKSLKAASARLHASQYWADSDGSASVSPSPLTRVLSEGTARPRVVQGTLSFMEYMQVSESGYRVMGMEISGALIGRGFIIVVPLIAGSIYLYIKPT